MIGWICNTLSLCIIFLAKMIVAWLITSVLFKLLKLI